MARNGVQFQKGLSEAEFDALYGTEDRCRDAVFAWRWPDGFVCPGCGGRGHCIIKTRALYQCRSCRRQASLIAGTIFAATKLPLRLWFRAMYHLTQSKGGISSLELARRLGVTQSTAWTLKHKLMQVMLERDVGKRLTGRVEMDDAYLGGERPGGKRGRGAPGKTPIIAAVETTSDGKPVRLKLRRVKGFRRSEIAKLARRSLDRASTAERWPRLLPRRRGGRVHASADPDRLGPHGGAAPGLQMGQHGARQHQDGDDRHLPGHPAKACSPLPRRIRVPLQSPL
jgi:transposase-like protein